MNEKNANFNEKSDILNEKSDILNEKSDILNEKSVFFNEKVIENENLKEEILYLQTNNELLNKQVIHITLLTLANVSVCV